MRRIRLMLVATLGACGSVTSHNDDASPPIDAPPDVLIDAAACPRPLLVGGTDVMPQGWSVVMQPPAQLSYGTDFVRVQTTTNTGATTSGQLMLNYPGALEVGKPFRLQVVMLVESVNPHNQYDSGAAIMTAFTPPFGNPADRSQMIYLDAVKIGWADDTQSFDAQIANNVYHTYDIAVDAANVARVSIDGTQALMRNGFVFNGAIALGDQTNDAGIDSVLRIRSVTRLCP